MAYSHSNICTKNYCSQKSTVNIFVGDWVLFWDTTLVALR